MTLGISDRHIEQTWRPTVHRYLGLVFWRNMRCHSSGGSDGGGFSRSRAAFLAARVVGAMGHAAFIQDGNRHLMNLDDIGNAVGTGGVSNRDVGLHSGHRELPDHTTPHLIFNSTLGSYAHTSELGVLNVVVMPLRAQITTCIISMRDGEQFARTSGVGVLKSLALPSRANCKHNFTRQGINLDTWEPFHYGARREYVGENVS
jgi:hypothetical protein